MENVAILFFLEATVLISNQGWRHWNIKGDTKLYFTHYSCVVIILFNTGLCRSAFSTISFRKLVVYLSVLPVFFALSQMFWTKILKYVLSWFKMSNWYEVFFSLCKSSRSSHRRCSIKKLVLKISQYSQENNCVGVSF